LQKNAQRHRFRVGFRFPWRNQPDGRQLGMEYAFDVADPCRRFRIGRVFPKGCRQQVFDMRFDRVNAG
jgi:hypothetical protein